jgi:hypothetical protein
MKKLVALVLALTLLVSCTPQNADTYTGTWIKKDKAEKVGNDLFSEIQIIEIHEDYFIAYAVGEVQYVIKLNGKLSDEFCVNDYATCTYKNAYCNKYARKIEADLVSIESNESSDELIYVAKPVIYLYPETETEVAVKLNLNGKLTCTYPKYNGGWNVIATPDGTLTDKSGKKYNYLYWEGETDTEFDFSRGFCVKGEDTAEFLEEALEKLGLSRREANEFIVYWLPLMETNPYNVIAFQNDIYTNCAKLNVTPTPNTVIRVFMAYTPSDTFVEILPQPLTAPTRNGFTVVEWGGTKVE